MGPGRPVFIAALALSLLLHLGLMAGAGPWWELPAEVHPDPLEVRFQPGQAAEDRAPPAPSSPPKPQRQAPPPVAPPPQAELPQEPEPRELEPQAPQEFEPPVEAVPATADALPTAVAAAAPDPAPQPSPTPPRPGTRSLPEHMVLQYSLRIGDDGMRVGRVTYTWRLMGERYSLVSLAQATGLAAVFMGDKIIQSSEGRVGPQGLMPGLYWITRSGKRQDMARFDWGRMRLDLANTSEPLRANAQDLLSVPFHLAMTVDEQGPPWVLPVSNGRGLKGYHFSVVGRETLEIDGVPHETVHARGTRAFEGHLDVWLAPAQHWLPVRIRTEDKKGKILQLTLSRQE